MGVNTDSYEWEGKEDFEPVAEKENSHPNIPVKRPKQVLDVKQEMKIRVSIFAVSNMTWLPKQVYDTCRAEIDEKYPSGWCGIQYNTAINLVCNSRRQLNFGDAISTVENTPDYYQMTDNERSFLQVSMTFPNPVVGENPIRIMIFGNPGLIGMPKTPSLDVFVDATFDCTPHPFLQCLIFMIYDHSTSYFIPILYALMTSNCKEAYWHTFNQIVCNFPVANQGLHILH
jgi:hypothetical protein